jgi:hypothetical protein
VVGMLSAHLPRQPAAAQKVRQHKPRAFEVVNSRAPSACSVRGLRQVPHAAHQVASRRSNEIARAWLQSGRRRGRTATA